MALGPVSCANLDANAIQRLDQREDIEQNSIFLELRVFAEPDILDVRDGQGVAVDVTIRPVPCPHTGNIMIRYRMYNSQSPFYWTALEYVAYNHVYPILAVEIRAEVGHEQWYPLTPDWVARWNELNVPRVIPYPDPINGPVRLRITSLYGDVVTTDLIQHPDRPVPGAAGTEDFYYDSGVQFPARSIDPGPCMPNLDCGNWMLDPAEECESSEQLSADCVSLGAGTGTAYCDPGTCLWDRSTCSNP